MCGYSQNKCVSYPVVLPQMKLEEAKKAAEMVLARAQHCRLALDVMVSLSPATLVPAADAAASDSSDTHDDGGGQDRPGGLDAQYPPSQRRLFILRGGVSVQTKWVRYIMWKFFERVNLVNPMKEASELLLPSADTCNSFARAARHAHWLVQVRGVGVQCGVKSVRFTVQGVSSGLLCARV